MELRDYQRRTLERLDREKGNTCVVLPCGAGKSLIIARLLSDDPFSRILVVCHQKELLEQDAKIYLEVAPNTDYGFYIRNDRNTKSRVIFATIQSIYKADKSFLSQFHLVVIDEAHLLNPREEGMYRTLLKSTGLARVIGFTATPYRQDGLITEGRSPIFTSLIEEAKISELIHDGYLSPLINKGTKIKFDIDNIPLSGKEFNLKEMEKVFNRPLDNEGAVNEILIQSDGRKHVVIYCSGVSHASNIDEFLKKQGLKSTYVSGEMDLADREFRLDEFKKGNINYICNANLLTTGFDYPEIDCIVLLRSTMSTGLYMQMVGRGLRKAEGKKDCLIIDFGGNIERHGPITEVKPKLSPVEKNIYKALAPAKTCPECLSIVPAQTRKCECGYLFPRKKEEWLLSVAPIVGSSQILALVKSWSVFWRQSKKGEWMVQIEYNLYNHQGIAYAFLFPLTSERWKKKDVEIRRLNEHAPQFDLSSMRREDWSFWSSILSTSQPPVIVVVKKNTNGFKIVTDFFFREDLEKKY